MALITFGAGEEGLLVDAVQRAGYRGLVVEGTGGGHVTARTVPELERLAKLMPVVLASRTAGGEALHRTYMFTGSEVDLEARGFDLRGGDDRRARSAAAPNAARRRRARAGRSQRVSVARLDRRSRAAAGRAGLKVSD